MMAYERPVIEDLGTMADLTQAMGGGPGADSSFPVSERLTRLVDQVTHS